ncbi:hypothetical protein Q2T41_10420 [Maribacter confluentis]|uniref:Peptidase M48 domain-containing protein n=1 Tax=Maribacter confluentis TaxID=1656093 RepID=A0ABT8RQB2_9FLAO|nr:hypothetical protein [Maribacter confluentis]MDO1513070.1 hypothetical protein [Maribacter confluentis]
MKYLVPILLILLLHAQSNAQGFQQDIVIEDIDELCFGYQSEMADPEAELIVDQMMAQMQLKKVFKLRKCAEINNAIATIEQDENGNSQPYILYDPKWLNGMDNSSKTDWASIGVLAHEVGHFLLYHALNKKGSNPRWEIDADRFAGKTMAMMGSTLEEAQSMFDNYTLIEDSRTHPGKVKRLEAVKTGWMNVNNPTKNVVLNENTSDRDINPELIFTRYFKKMGGLKNMGLVKQIQFKEVISEKIGVKVGQKAKEYAYEYELSSNKTRVISRNFSDPEEYLIVNNDSLSFKYLDKEKWNQGAPKIGTTVNQDPYDFKRKIRPSIFYFFDDFLWISNPEITDYRRRKDVDDEECFTIELPEITMEHGNLNKKGKRIVLTKRYYYSTYSGLLHAIEEEEEITEYKRGQPKNGYTRKTEMVLSGYESVDVILLPTIISKKITFYKSDILQENETIFQERKITDLELKQASTF